ncbi:MAG: hypothetical protein JNK71_00855 [Methyloversatilis sp.]|nr:hypothetical protein [Methyloversatilis sp.]
MKLLRGGENLRKFNEQRELKALMLIKEQLVRCQKHRLSFKSMGALADYLASTTSIHRTTFIRNPRYKSLLTTSGLVQNIHCPDVCDQNASPIVLRARLLALELENSNLTQKLQRMEVCVKSLQAQSKAVLLPASDGSNSDYLAFVDTAMALTALLRRLNDSISINFDKKTIEDRAARSSQRVVVGPERTTAYLDWFQANKDKLFEFDQGVS